jgi:hypothetical protein
MKDQGEKGPEVKIPDQITVVDVKEEKNTEATISKGMVAHLKMVAEAVTAPIVVQDILLLEAKVLQVRLQEAIALLPLEVIAAVVVEAAVAAAVKAEAVAVASAEVDELCSIDLGD